MLSLTISCCYGSKKIGEGQATCGALDDDIGDEGDEEDVDLVVRRTGWWRIIRRAAWKHRDRLWSPGRGRSTGLLLPLSVNVLMTGIIIINILEPSSLGPPLPLPRRNCQSFKFLAVKINFGLFRIKRLSWEWKHKA